MSKQRVKLTRTWNPYTSDLDLRTSMVSWLQHPVEFGDEVGWVDPFVVPGPDQGMCILNVWCQCGRAAWVEAIERHRRLPGSQPLFVLRTKHWTTKGDGDASIYKEARTLLDTGGEPVLDMLVEARGAVLPPVLTTDCRTHGTLTMTTSELHHASVKAYRAILAAEKEGRPPKCGRFKARHKK